MNVVVRKSKLSGVVNAPPSKSHTHRALLLASLARGTSEIENMLICRDTEATIRACEALGAKIKGDTVTGVSGAPKSKLGTLNVENSGTTLRFLTALKEILGLEGEITGDDSVMSRPIKPLTEAAKSIRSSCSATLSGISSQFVSGLLMACPLLKTDSTLIVKSLKSKPYLEMTLEHLKRVGIEIEHKNLEKFTIKGGQIPKAANFKVPGDFSAAAFLLIASEVTGSEITVEGLDLDDAQGDKRILDILKRKDAEIDLSNNPDLLPIVAVLACFREGTTKIINTEHARLKECDRISAMAVELKKMGADIEETPDGLVIKHSTLHGAVLDGHKDHRVVMALAVAGLAAEGKTVISDAESIAVSYPNFIDDLKKLGAEIELMDGNKFGKNFIVEAFGTSHGPEVGCVIKGCPAGVEIDLGKIQAELDRRKPGTSKLSSARKEPDKLIVVSGIESGKTIGGGIKLAVKNLDIRSKDYSEIINKPRPGHSDMSAFLKYGGIEPGGGRFSGRETVGRVLAGAVAKQILEKEGITVTARVVEIGGKTEKFEETILKAKKERDSVGGIVEITAQGVPAGLGEPVFDKLDAELAKALMSIPAVKGVEIGAGFGAAKRKGSENNDLIIVENGQLKTKTNNAGGILGGVSNGMPIVCGIAVKPTSSIGKEQDTVDLRTMKPAKLTIKGRHDPCIVPRILPVAETMVALVLIDLLL